MIDSMKEKLLAKGMQLMQSPMVAKLMESEKVGVLLEKAMTLPIKLSDGMRAHREKLTSILDLATQQDLDDLKRAVSRMEDLLREVKRESADLLTKSDKGFSAKKPVAE